MKYILFMVLALTFIVSAQTNPVRIRHQDSDYTSVLISQPFGTLSSNDSVTSSYKSNFKMHEFGIQKTRLYKLWFDVAGGTNYAEDTGWGTKIVFGRDILYSVQLQATADADNDGLINFAGLETALQTWKNDSLRSPYYYIAANDAQAIDKVVADAVCDGTLDRSQILAAITDGRRIMLSEGTFNLGVSGNDALLFDSDTSIVLEGAGYGTILKVGSGDEAHVITVRDCQNLKFRHLKLDGQGGTQSTRGLGLNIITSSQVDVEYVWAHDTYLHGFGVYGSVDVDLKNSRVTDTRTGHSVDIDVSSTTPNTDILVDNLRIETNASYTADCIKVENARYVTVTNSTFIQNNSALINTVIGDIGTQYAVGDYFFDNCIIRGGTTVLIKAKFDGPVEYNDIKQYDCFLTIGGASGDSIFLSADNLYIEDRDAEILLTTYSAQKGFVKLNNFKAHYADSIGLKLQGGAYYEINNVHLDSVGDAGIIMGADGSKITGGYIGSRGEHATTEKAITLSSNANENLVMGVTIEDFLRGIEIDGDDNVVQGNMIDGHSTGSGIREITADYNFVHGNWVKGYASGTKIDVSGANSINSDNFER